jgi:hypothetical protein
MRNVGRRWKIEDTALAGRPGGPHHPVMVRLAVYATLSLVSLAVLPFLAPSGRVFPLVSGLLVGVLIPLADAVLIGRERLRLLWFSFRYRNQMIRVSLCYLFRIRIDDRYLFVRSARAPVFLPVGGVYKATAGAKDFFDSIGVLADDLVPIDVNSRDDLRVRLPGRHLAAFMRWFEQGTCRETDQWREFYEELVEPGIVPARDFRWIRHQHLRRRSSGIRFGAHAQSLEIIVGDVRELLPSAAQLKALRNLRKASHPDVAWLTEQQIRHAGAVPGVGQTLQTGLPVSQWVV